MTANCTVRIVLFCIALIAFVRSFPAQTLPVSPNLACAECHRNIYEQYRNTPMANASGSAISGLTPADFTHLASGVHYRIYSEGKQVYLSYDRPQAIPGRQLHGRQELVYFLGSGKRGRTYLFEQQGYWFESPINWYAKKQIWDMTPNYLGTTEMPLTLPVDPSCLRCHASDVQSSLPDARNHYATMPFLNGGITCTACHGDPSAHIAAKGHAPILNPKHLGPVRRDSICLNCHLEGKVVVVRNDKSLLSFKPGDNLFDYASFFVPERESGSGGRATSQWEALLQSACKRASGDRLSCTTCHDPHSSPSSEKQVQFYRQKCISCHSQPAFATNHHPEQQDCTSCHMPRSSTTDIAHEQVTDHRIQRYPNLEPPASVTGKLVAVGGMNASDRELGLAYAQIARHGDKQAIACALPLLQSAEQQQSLAVSDHELHTDLGFLEQITGNTVEAQREYQAALSADPLDSIARGNLAFIDAQEHNYQSATRQWQTVFSHDPAQITAGIDLAQVQCSMGQRDAALAALDRVLIFSPDNQQAHRMQIAILSSSTSCKEK
jgi:predicted CXXCH cytochrome family protein